jgi:hypothetical protein
MRKRMFLLLGYRGGTIALCLVLAFSMVACSTTWVVDLETYLPVAVAGATGIISILVSSGALGPVIPAEVSAVEAAVTDGLNLLCGTPVNNQCNPASLIGQFAASPTMAGLLTKIQSTIADIQANLQKWLSLIHIKNSVLQATISAAISLILTTLSAIAARISPVAMAAVHSGRKAAMAAIVKAPKMPISAAQFKAQLNRIFSDGGYSSVAIP